MHIWSIITLFRKLFLTDFYMFVVRTNLDNFKYLMKNLKVYCRFEYLLFTFFSFQKTATKTIVTGTY